MAKYLAIIIAAVCILFTAYKAHDLHGTVHQRKVMMEDYAEINKANYELFNIQLWKEQALDIIKIKINDFEIAPATYDFLDLQVQGYLKVLHTRYIEKGELADVIVDELKKSGQVNAFMMKIVTAQVPDLVKQLNLKPYIPGVSDQIISEIKSNEPQIMEYVHAELLRLVLEESSDEYRDRRQGIYNRYNQVDADATDAYLSAEVLNLDNTIKSKIIWIIGLVLLSILLCLVMGKVVDFKLMIIGLTLISIILLVLGVSMPMIDIDARLNSFSFTLLDESITFDEQIIYYQSKSIVEVTKTLWQGGTWDLRLVGVLVITFSIIFPIIKLLLSGLFLFTEKVKNSKVAQTIIFQLGKWSMADVFVVAIFMAYIGFYGIISSQLQGLSQNDGGFDIETVNYSRLSPGAFFFTAYVLLSIIISIFISRKKTEIN